MPPGTNSKFLRWHSSLKFCDPIDCSPSGPSVHGIFWARILEWVATSSSRGSSWSRHRTQVSWVSCISRQTFYLRLPKWLRGKDSTCQCRILRRLGFDAWVRKIPWRRKWQPTPVFLSGNSMDKGAWWATVHVVPRVGHDWAHTHISCHSFSTLPLPHIHSSYAVATDWSQLGYTVFTFPRSLLLSRIFMLMPLSHLIRNWTKFLRSNENIMSGNHWGRTTHSLTRDFTISCHGADHLSLILWFLLWSMCLPATNCEQLESKNQFSHHLHVSRASHCDWWSPQQIFVAATLQAQTSHLH